VQQDAVSGVGDDAAIRALIAFAEAAINRRDFAALAALYTTDGDTIIASRPRTSGRDAIRRSAEAAWATAPSARRLSMTVDAIRFLDSDVAIADTTARFSAGEPREDRGTWVVVRRDGRWLVGAFRVQPAEQP
jgi:uncharacterized protein (TIGR02246 family)